MSPKSMQVKKQACEFAVTSYMNFYMSVSATSSQALNPEQSKQKADRVKLIVEVEVIRVDFGTAWHLGVAIKHEKDNLSFRRFVFPDYLFTFCAT